MSSSTERFPSIADEDGAVVLDVERGLIMTMNVVGAFIWRRLQERSTLDAIAHDLAHETGTDIGIVDRDVHVFADQLRVAGLFES